MMFLKPTPIITAVIIKTLIVLTIIDHVFSDVAVEYCTKYIKKLYRYSTLYNEHGHYVGIGSTDADENINDDLLAMFKKGFLVYNETEINKINMANANFGSFKHKFENENEKNTAIKKWNRYTFGYFKEFLSHVSIDGKDLLRNPAQFCFGKYQGIQSSANLCMEIIKKKFNLRGEESGSQIFDIFYEKWTKIQVKKVLAFEDEQNELQIDLIRTALFNPGNIESKRSEALRIIKIYGDSLQHFYKQFEEILNVANASQMLTPEDYCARTIGEASSS